MKKTIFAFIVLFAATATHSQAEQYSLYVTHADRVSPSQVQFSSLVQKEILIDTATKRVRLSLSAICGPNTPCPEMIRMVNFNLVKIQKNGSHIASLKAEGAIMINGTNAYTTVEITQNANNAMTIQVVSTLAHELSAKAVSVFYGSPTQDAFFL